MAALGCKCYCRKKEQEHHSQFRINKTCFIFGINKKLQCFTVDKIEVSHRGFNIQNVFIEEKSLADIYS